MNIQAKIEPEIQEVSQLEDIARWATDLADLKRKQVPWTSDNYLWSEWHFAKALSEFLTTDDSAGYFAEVCDNLGVNEDGEPVGNLGCAEADYRYDMERDSRAAESFIPAIGGAA